jgi:spermidine/putrescine transport system permease protein
LFLYAFTGGYLVWSLVPVLVAAMFSFNNGRSRSTWQGFSWQWYFGNPAGGASSVFQDPALTHALFQTLRISFITVIFAVPVGTAFAIGIDRWRGRKRPVRAARDTTNFLMLFSFVTPELILGITVLLVFSEVLQHIHLGGFFPFGLGTPAQILALITFEMSYPVIIVRARLLSVGRQYEEAAMDLGAPPTTAMWKVLMPLLYPAIFASTILVIADVMDDFIIVRYLSAGSSSEPLSVKIYGGFRGTVTPVYNAMATIMAVMTLLVVAIGILAYSRIQKKRGVHGSSTEEFALTI